VGGPVSIWQDVVFDAGTAHAAAAELRDAATALVDHSTRRGDLAIAAQDGWRGEQRRRFDPELATLEREAGELIAALRSAADRIEDDLSDAIQMQRSRENAREEYWREQRRLQEMAQRGPR
jgi:uncharacterized protein YukE